QPRKAVVVRASGGDAPPTLPLRTPTFDVWCIGETKFEAERVEAAVYDALKSMQRVVVGDRLLHWAQLIGGPHSGFDRDSEWPSVLSTYQVRVSDVAVSEVG